MITVYQDKVNITKFQGVSVEPYITSMSGVVDLLGQFEESAHSKLLGTRDIHVEGFIKSESEGYLPLKGICTHDVGIYFIVDGVKLDPCYGEWECCVAPEGVIGNINFV